MNLLPIVLAQEVSDEAGAAVAGAVGIGLLVFFIIMAIIGIALFVFWIWSIIDCVKREFPGDNDKVLWLVVIIVLGVLGSFIYLIAGRKKGTIKTQSETPAEPSK